jgi:hypothetical protein
LKLFDDETGLACDPNAEDGYACVRTAELFERIDRNMDLFFRVLMPMLGSYVPAIDILRTGKPHIVVGGGEASGSQLPYRAASALARRLGTHVSHFPGDHGGFTTHPEAFADRLHAVFEASGR